MESLSPNSYEFSGSQNELIQDLAKKMQFVSYVLLAFGSIVILGSIVAIARGESGNIIMGVIQILLGVWTGKAASSFRKIVETRGNDIENLMGALGELRKLYTLQFWLFIIGIIFMILAFILAILIGTPRLGR